MQILIKHSNGFRFIFGLCVMVVSGCSCFSTKPAHDPLKTFYVARLNELNSNKAISADYKVYIQTLSPEERARSGEVVYFADGKGQHAVKIMIGLNGIEWIHILIYDKDNIRLKTIKYSAGHYTS